MRAESLRSASPPRARAGLRQRGSSGGEGGSDALLSTPPVVDWDPLQRQLREAKSALATVEARLRRLETSVDPLATNQ